MDGAKAAEAAAATATSATSLCNGIAGGEREATAAAAAGLVPLVRPSVRSFGRLLVFASMCCANFIYYQELRTVVRHAIVAMPRHEKRILYTQDG